MTTLGSGTITATFNGQEIGTMNAEDISISRADLRERIPSFSMNSEGDVSINGNNIRFGDIDSLYRGTLYDDLRTTAPTVRTIGTGTISVGRITSPQQTMADYMEDYLRNRNAENPIFINHNTSQRPVEYNDINDVVEFRTYLDSIIKEYYQRG